MDRVETLGGRLSVNSPRGAGTTVRMSLPLIDPTVPGSRAVMSPPRDLVR
jgi:hypothetical protein